MLFFELLRVALGNQDKLSPTPSAEDWVKVYDEAERQAVAGLLLRGIDRLPTEQRPSQVLLFQWIGFGQMVEQRNLLMDERCQNLLAKLNDSGLHGTILKGQGVARLYDKKLCPLRQSGDIDVYVDCGLQRALLFAKSQDQINLDWDYKHLHLNLWGDTEVEMHYRVEVLLNLWKNKRLQKWFKKYEEELFARENDNLNFTTPTTAFNVFYILLHIYRHFLYEGVGFRQIVDYYFVLKKVKEEEMDVDYSLEAVSKFGLERFAGGLMWVMMETLGMPEEWALWEPDKKEGEYILSQLMQGGNFGHHDERLRHRGGKWNAVRQICKHNWHLLMHYPADVIWAPIWFIWHKCWKVKTGVLLALR